MVTLGYDVTFSRIAPDGPAPLQRPAPGWRSIGWNPELRLLRLPAGCALDLGATAKALAADRAAGRAASAAGCGVLVNLGGDLATAGQPPRGGWRVAVADGHATANSPDTPVVSIDHGAMATSGTTERSWTRGGTVRHHIIDPATGDSVPPVWCTVSVTAANCVDANTASTAAVVMGERALAWLASAGLPARLVAADGSVRRVGGWPMTDRRSPRGEAA
jgi:thiamine biosynthesis lipoprotein